MGVFFKTSLLLETRTLRLLVFWIRRRKNGMVSYHWTHGRKSTIMSGWADVFPSLQCFSNPLKYQRTATCLLCLWFFSQPWICCGAIFRWQRSISTVWTQFPVYDILEVNQNATSLREQLWHSFWGAWLGLSLSVCLSNSNLNCRNCKPVSLMKSSGLLQRGV